MHSITPPPSLVSDACSVSPWPQICETEVSLLRKPLLVWGKNAFFIWISNCGFVFRSKLSSDLDSEKSTRGGRGGLNQPIFKCSNARAVEGCRSFTLSDSLASSKQSREPLVVIHSMLIKFVFKEDPDYQLDRLYLFFD